MSKIADNCLASNRWTVNPLSSFDAVLRVPGDKSISHRVAMLAGLGSGVSRISGFLEGDDCLCTVNAMRQMGADVERQGCCLQIKGTGGVLRQPQMQLDLGNSGTSIRLLAGLVAGCKGRVVMTGDDSLRSRPMRRISDPLTAMGINVEYIEREGYAPLVINGGVPQSIDYQLPVASAQVKSCVLLAGLWAEGVSTVEEPAPCRDHTEMALIRAGLPCEVAGSVVRVSGSSGNRLDIPALEWIVPGDFSSAAFWIVAAAARPGAVLRVDGVGLNPRRIALVDILRRMGADIVVIMDENASGEPLGSIIVRGGALHGTVVSGNEIPNAIDEIPVLAVAAALAEGVTEIRDAAELRVKESDRITVMSDNLKQAGVGVESRADGMLIEGSSKIPGGGVFDSHGDHRIAMSMAVLATYGRAPSSVINTACVNTSYPGFVENLQLLRDNQN